MHLKFLGLCLVASVASVWIVPASAATTMDPCSLLTPAQVSTALGAMVGPAKHLATTVCVWDVPNEPPGSNLKRVTVTLLTERGFEAAKTPVGGTITKVPVSGIGDEAVFGTTGKLAAVLSVKKGPAAFAVRVQGFPLDQPQGVADVQAKEKSLASQIVSRL